MKEGSWLVKFKDLIDEEYPEFEDEGVFSGGDLVFPAVSKIAKHVGFREMEPLRDFENQERVCEAFYTFMINTYIRD